ncbi:Protein phosphatase Slingshot-like protein 2-like [Oopsacas minuta]|uniref:protein-serine/threonine phosphatase n=1 Tax=Oopsacas minuta TaxID=111878 RepID=A0AAV7JEI4_9METZ|nr:Protein phosphatase Slingshot-like protein 2-like [Oopsacas minuta]
MSLLTIERPTSAASSIEQVQDETDSDTVSQSSYDGFYANKHLALAIPHMVRRVSIVSTNSYNIIGDLQHHLHQLMSIMRPRERIDMVVALEQANPSKTKYLILVTAYGNEDTEESCLLGTESVNQEFRIVLVIPLWKNTVLKYFGDGGFKLTSGYDAYVFKTSSVPCMWAASNAICTAVENARDLNYYSGGTSHTWVPYYKDKLTDNRQSLHEWYMMDEVTSFFRPDSPIFSIEEDPIDDETTFKRALISQLRENMSHTDLENVTSRDLRLQLEAQFNRPLKSYLSFLDEQMLFIFGQMKKPSEILSFLYLGSEWNASNLSELRQLGVGYIINISREVDNFFPDTFKYLPIRVYDQETSDLMRHWESTFKFISEARDNNSKVLVHCKMGVSRSASTVIAFLMKELNMSLESGISHVKERRNCIKPNKGFLEQLKTYEGILNARHKTFWSAKIEKKSHLLRCRSETSLIQDIHFPKQAPELCLSYSTSNLTPKSWRNELNTEQISANDSQTTSDIEPFDSSDTGSPVSSSPMSQPDETLLQMMSEGSDLPITQLSSDIAQAKREKMERENQQKTKHLTICDINVSEKSAFQPVAKRQKISTSLKTRPKSAVSSSSYKSQSLDGNFAYYLELPRSMPNSPGLKKANRMSISPTKLSPLLETSYTNTSILRPHSAPKSNSENRPTSEVLERTLSTPDLCELSGTKRHTITESISPNDSVQLHVQNFESLSLQNIRTACDSLSSSPPLNDYSIDLHGSSWSKERHSVSIENLSSHSSHQLGSNKSRIGLNKNSNNANHLSPSLRNTDNERLIENVQAYIQRLESMEKDRDEVLASSPRKMPCTLPEQENTVSAMKKIFEKDDDIEKFEDQIEFLNSNSNNNNNNNNTTMDTEFMIFPYIMESQETDC